MTESIVPDLRANIKERIREIDEERLILEHALAELDGRAPTSSELRPPTPLARRTSISTAILNAVASAGEPVTARDVVRILGWDSNKVGAVSTGMTRLARARRLVKVSRGYIPA